MLTPKSPPYCETILLEDDWIQISDVRCVAEPPSLGPREQARNVELILPLDGLFVRHDAPGRDLVVDSSMVVVVRPNRPYRVSHPVGGHDRAIVIGLSERAISDGMLPGSFAGGIPMSHATHLFARRWLAAMASGRLDPLAAADIGWAIVGRVLADGKIAENRPPLVVVDPIVDAARVAIAARVGERLTLSDLGRIVGCSPFRLARRFRAATRFPAASTPTRLPALWCVTFTIAAGAGSR